VSATESEVENWEIVVSDVSEVEATIRVSYRGAASESAAIRGTLRGPYCERAHTLPADYPFHASAGESATAKAVITDPCLWSEELPHVYHANVEAVHGEEVVAEYHGVVGLRRTSPMKNFDHIK
jgi:beta-galactosidase/beta-glucuronidase